MNLPNKLTLIRVCMVPVFVIFMLAEFVPYRYILALVIFTLASYTDHLDGKIARSQNLITNFGKLMDPLADKILVMSALICFVKLGLASTACVIVIMIREFAVTSIRLVAVEQGKVIPANNWGKAKTISQMVAIITILALQSLLQLNLLTNTGGIIQMIGDILMYIATFLTLISGVIYVKSAAYMFTDY